MALKKVNLRLDMLHEVVRKQFEGLSKWQIALLLGAPVTLGLAGLVYYNKKGKHVKSAKNNNDLKINNYATSPKTETSKKDTPKKSNEMSSTESALKAKEEGNVFFKSGKYNEAIESYTKAISLCSDNKLQLATFYQNRAAAYGQLENHQQVISDCSKALELNPKYMKALTRRAKSADQTGNLKIALEDLTLLCMLENFSNVNTVKFSERVLRDMGKQKAKVEMASRKPSLPSKTFMKVFRDMFRNDPIFNFDTSKILESSPFIEACKQFSKCQCDNIIDLCSKEMDQPDSPYINKARLLRGTAHFYMGAFTDAITDFEDLILSENVNKNVKVSALIKKASCYSQQSMAIEAMEMYSEAINIDPENVDIYFHRGQLLMLQDRCEDSVRDYEKCIELDPNFPHAHVYKCLGEHRAALINSSADGLEKVASQFERVVEKFPNCIEARIKFGQTLLGQNKPEKARHHFEKVLELEEDNAMATVYMGVLLLSEEPDFDKIRSYIEKAISMDEKYEYPYELFGSIEVHRGNIESAVTNFHKAISLSRSDHEITHLYTLLDATLAQLEVSRRLGNLALGQDLNGAFKSL
ncbi:mitochondrial import receptor subunit TOM70 [Octopus vulgaris]|uniref:Mitochondrial import receptor subunit TOM70 n=2 Tax=Octopus TaxID=6643 RepID=A0AA36AVP6_OCTVU|nr:mitochondrial import receptor subunit TOM70 [Octopus sinensis]CAI9722518.1 mitochondrial import receptor subunit TOM70 [Octopus vulgaris]